MKTVNNILIKDRRQMGMSLQTGSPGISCNTCSNVQSGSKMSVISLGGRIILEATHSSIITNTVIVTPG